MKPLSRDQILNGEADIAFEYIRSYCFDGYMFTSDLRQDVATFLDVVNEDNWYLDGNYLSDSKCWVMQDMNIYPSHGAKEFYNVGFRKLFGNEIKKISTASRFKTGSDRLEEIHTPTMSQILDICGRKTLQISEKYEVLKGHEQFYWLMLRAKLSGVKQFVILRGFQNNELQYEKIIGYGNENLIYSFIFLPIADKDKKPYITSYVDLVKLCKQNDCGLHYGEHMPYKSILTKCVLPYYGKP